MKSGQLRFGGGGIFAPSTARSRNFQQALAALRIFEVSQNLAGENLQSMRSGSPQSSLGIGIGIDIYDPFASQLILMFLGPFGGSKQAKFFAVPQGQYDAALGLPALFPKSAEGSCGFEQR